MTSEGEGQGVLKTLGAVVLIGATLASTVAPVFLSGSSDRGPQTVRVVDEDGKETERGYMTSLTRSEILTKLSQVPVFYLKDDSGGVHVEGGEGLFFMSPEDAQAKLGELKDGGASKVAATTLDDVWFPLIKKKGPNRKPRGAEASTSSDLSARYRIVPRASQLDQAAQTEGWANVRDKDGVPVWVATSLAFRGPGSSYKIPLFTNLEDLMTSWDRLKAGSSAGVEGPKIQVSSIGAIVELMENGGGDNRKLEFFADMDAIGQADKLLGTAPSAT